MYTDYLTEVKESALKGVSTLFKKSLKYHAIVYVGLFVLMILISLITIGSAFMQMNDPVAMSQKYQSFFLNYGGLVFLFIPIVLLIAAWIYTLGLAINENVVKLERGDIAGALKKSFSNTTFQMFFYMILYLVIYVLGILAVALVSALFGIASQVFAVVVAIIVGLVLFVFLIRFMAGPAYIVHGNMGAIEALKASLNSITWVRAIILLVISIAIIIVFYFIIFAIMMMVGLNIFNPQAAQETFADPTSMSGLGAKMILLQLVNMILGIVFTAFGYAALSSLYFRYNQSNESEKDEQVADHLLTD